MAEEIKTPIKRYSNWCIVSHGHDLVEKSDGLWVTYRDHITELTLITQERDALRDCFREIETWANAYPLNVFPEPDLKRAHEVLKSAGMTLDAISASNMRHVLNGVMEIAKRTLKTEGTS